MDYLIRPDFTTSEYDAWNGAAELRESASERELWQADNDDSESLNASARAWDRLVESNPYLRELLAKRDNEIRLGEWEFRLPADSMFGHNGEWKNVAEMLAQAEWINRLADTADNRYVERNAIHKQTGTTGASGNNSSVYTGRTNRDDI